MIILEDFCLQLDNDNRNSLSFKIYLKFQQIITNKPIFFTRLFKKNGLGF
jgi:hypothetical protein